MPDIYNIYAGVEPHDELSPIREAMWLGDWTYIEAWLRRGNPIFPELREYLADILAGKRKRSNNRPGAFATRSRRYWIALSVRRLRRAGIAPVAAETQVMAEYGVDRRTVQRALKECGDAAVADWVEATSEDWG